MRPIEILDASHNLNKAKGICTTCGDNIGILRDKLSLTEWGISGMCQKCQDSVFNNPAEEDIFKNINTK